MYSDFGSILRNARMRQGYDINTVARRLRIRPDVIHSIEMADFDRMPPRGYARNMISSYARLLGLDPSQITRQYLDELHTYQMGRVGGQAQNRSASASRSRNRRTNGDPQAARERDARRRDRNRAEGRSRTEGRNRAEGDNRRTRRDGGSGRAGEQARRNGQSGRTRRSGSGARGAGAAGRGGSSGISLPADLRDRLPFMGIAIAVIVLVIILLVLIFGPKGTDSQEVANMPVTGVESATVSSADLSESSSDDDSSSSSVTEPTSFTFSYEVADGTTVWIDCTVDGQSRVSQQVTGPTKQEFTVSKSVTFTSGATDGVTVKQDDDEVELKSDGTGTYSTTLKFSSYLKSWRKAHNIDTSDSSSSSSDSSSSSSTDESTSTDDTESSSTTTE